MTHEDILGMGYIFDDNIEAYEIEPGVWLHHNDSEEKWGIHDGCYHGEELEVYFYGYIETVKDFKKLLTQVI